LNDGRLLLHVPREKQASNLQRLDTFCNLKVNIYPHQHLNSSKGIIRDRRLFCCSEDEIKSELAEQGVTHVKRIKINKGGEYKPSNSLILTFGTPQLPKTLKIFYQVIAVTPFIPNPLRCFYCQRFGHHENKCKNAPVCANCAGVGNHHEGSCDKLSKCANCGGDHPANSNKCPVWLKEKEVTKLKFTNNISYPEARKLLENLPEQTYSQIVKSKSTQNAATQTCDASTQTAKDMTSIQTTRISTVSHDTVVSGATVERSMPDNGKSVDSSAARQKGSPEKVVSPPVSAAVPSTEVSGTAVDTRKRVDSFATKQKESAKEVEEPLISTAALDTVVSSPAVEDRKKVNSSARRQKESTKPSKEADEPKKGRAEIKQNLSAKQQAKKLAKALPKRTTKSSNKNRFEALSEPALARADCEETNPPPDRGSGSDKPPEITTKGTSKALRLKRVEASTNSGSSPDHGSRSRSHSPILPPKL
jgi:hypothetical protein